MRPIHNREEYLSRRNTIRQRQVLKAVRQGKEEQKSQLIQMNYSCLPNEDGALKGSKRMSSSVGMDIDHIAADEMEAVKERILEKKEELGLLMLELSARGAGYHLVFKRKPELTQEGNLKWASELLKVEFDKGAKDITRVFFTTTEDEENLLYLDDEIFEKKETLSPALPRNGEGDHAGSLSLGNKPDGSPHYGGDVRQDREGLHYNGLPYSDIISKWWELYNEGKEPMKSNRDVLTFELAVNLRHICGFDRELMAAVIPCYDGFAETQKMKCIDSALAEKRTQMPKRLKDVLFQVRRDRMNDVDTEDALSEGKGLEEAVQEDERFYYNQLPKMPMGVKESIDAVGPALSMPVVTAICPAIGMLATGVKLNVHGKENTLNLISYIAGDFASGKGSIDPVIDAWMGEVKALDMMYQQQEDEWRAKKRAAKNKKE